MAHIELGDGRIQISSEYRERELIKQVPGARWDNGARTWWAPLSWASCVAFRGVFGDRLTVGPELSAWSVREHEDRVGPSLQARTWDDSTGDPRLYPFQRVGVQFMKSCGSALLGDEPGLGKTVEAIRAIREMDTFPCLVVCPNSVKHVWKVLFEAWAPDVRTVVIEGGAAKRRERLAEVALTPAEDRPVVIINWESLRLHTRLAGYGSIRLTDEEKTDRELNTILWKCVVSDEAHRGSDPKAKQTRALWGVSRAPTVEHRFALTGTPSAESPLGLWGIMHFVSPEEWASRPAFIDRYCVQTWGYNGSMEIIGLKSETRDELFSFLDPRFLRRTKAAVLPQLPPKTYVTRIAEFGGKQAKAYKQLTKTMLAELDSGVLVTTNPLQKMTRLVQLASAYGEIVADEDGSERFVLSEPSCKIDALVEVADELGGKQAVVFAESRQLIELADARLTKLGYGTALITGSVDTTQRAMNVEAFQAGQVQFVLATMGAGGEGLTLTAADTEIFLQRSFSSVKNLQAEDRIHRIGQEASAVMIVDIVTEDTVEDRVREVREEKAAMFEEVVRDEETLRWLIG